MEKKHEVPSSAAQLKALQLVAKWMSRKMGGAAVPTGADAARHGLGPELNPAWSWVKPAQPTILLEGSEIYDWAVEVSLDPWFVAQMAVLRIYAEPYAGYALCLYAES